MRYQELYDEYSELLRRETDLRVRLQSLPFGYITKRKISGKEYSYLQYTCLLYTSSNRPFVAFTKSFVPE